MPSSSGRISPKAPARRGDELAARTQRDREAAKAMAAKEKEQQAQATWNTAEQDRLDADTRKLLDEAAAPETPRAEAVAKARKAMVQRRPQQQRQIRQPRRRQRRRRGEDRRLHGLPCSTTDRDVCDERLAADLRDACINQYDCWDPHRYICGGLMTTIYYSFVRKLEESNYQGSGKVAGRVTAYTRQPAGKQP